MTRVPALLAAPLAALIGAMMGATAGAQTLPSGCAAAAQCPTSVIAGTVVVDGAFDGLGSRGKPADGILASDEIQCAIDCLDGDREPEHVLPARRALYEPPPFISGGTLVFVPESPPAGVAPAKGQARLRYEIDGPLELPFSSTHLVLRGEGAVLRLVTPASDPCRAIFRRTVPSSASPRDVEFLASFTEGWLFEGFQFVDPKPGAGGPPSTAIELQGAHRVIISRCNFQGFDRGVELHFCILPTIRDCFFFGGRDRDIIVADGTGCGADPGACWTGKEGWLRESGSHHARLLGNHHMTATTATASVFVARSLEPVLDGAVFEGSRPKHSLLVSWLDMAMEVTLRDTYVEFAENPQGNGIFRFECGGVLRVDGINVTDGYEHDLLVDLSAATDLQVTVDHCGWLPAGIQFSNGPQRYRNTWTFREVVKSGPLIEDPARWIGGVAGVPVHLVTDGLEGGVRARVVARGLLEAPWQPPLDGGPPPPGAIWFDPATHQFMGCCDKKGEVRPLVFKSR